MSTARLPVTGRRLHVAAERHNRDLSAAQTAAHAFLIALGFDLDQEALAETPARMAKAYMELLTPRDFDLTTFPNDEGYEQLVLVQAFRSGPCANITRCHSLVPPMSAIFRESGSSDCPSWPCSGAVRPPRPCAGADDQAGY